MIGNYFCTDCTCGETGKGRDFTAEIESREEIILCPNSEKDLPLKLMGVKTHIGINTGQFKKGRSEKEKAERRRKSWHEDVAPQMGLDIAEKQHFEKKFGKSLKQKL